MPSFWYKEFACQLCGNDFSYPRIFSDAIMVESRDEDLKPNFKGVNALYYQVITCPNCYLTLFERDFGTLNIPDEKIDKVKRVLENAKKEFGKLNLGEDRELDDAIKLFSIAAAVYTVMDHSRGAAEAYLKLAWLYREKGMDKEEKVALAKSLKFFEKHFKEEITNEREEPMILFYLGELNKLLGNKREAVKWFSILVNKYRGVPSPYIKAAQERWQEVRD